MKPGDVVRKRGEDVLLEVFERDDSLGDSIVYYGCRPVGGGEPRWIVAEALEASRSFTCPRCGMTSGHPQDVAQGYCGACHDWTGS